MGHAAIDVWAIGEAALWSVFPRLRSGRRSRSFASQGYSMQEVARRLGRVASTISEESCGATPPPEGGGLQRIVRRQLQWHAEQALLAAQSRRSLRCCNAALRTYVEERLAGVVVGMVKAWICCKNTGLG